MTLLGIDVSNHQGIVKWPLIARSGVKVAAIKCSQGTWYPDKFYPINVVRAMDAGIATVAYHYGEPFSNSGRAEAHYLLSCGISLVGPRNYALDLEDGPLDNQADLGAYALDFLETIYAETGKRAFLYTNQDYARRHKLASTPGLAAFPLWLASWQSVEPSSFAPWSRWSGWQFTAAGFLPGVGKVDMDLFEETALG